MSLRTWGLFLPRDEDQVRERLDRAHQEVDRLTTALEQKRREAAKGHVQREVLALGAAYRDKALAALLDQADEAEKAADKAKRAEHRSTARAKDPAAMTKRRKLARIETEGRLKEIEARLAAEWVRREIADPPRRFYGSTLRASLLKQIHYLAESVQTMEIERQLAEARAREAELEEELDLVEANRVPAEILQGLALYVRRRARHVLAKVALDDYRPQKATMAKVPEFAALERAGLLVLNSTANPTALGDAVADWTREHMSGDEILTQEPAMTAQEVLESFDREEIKAMVLRARRALKEPEGGLVELGEPERGYSYRVNRNRQALTDFLVRIRAVKPQEKPSIPKEPPQYRRGWIDRGCGCCEPKDGPTECSCWCHCPGGSKRGTRP